METVKVNDDIALKSIEPADAEAIFTTIDTQREYLGKWLPFVEFTKTVEDTLKFIAAIVEKPEKSRERVFVIKYQGNFAGLIGYKDTDWLNHKSEIGYWLSESFQKKGIVAKSVKALISYGFNKMELNRIQIKCAVGNIPSKRIPINFNFKFEGIERNGELLTGGEYTDLEVYSLLASEFKA